MPIIDQDIKEEIEAEGLLADRSLPASAATKLSTALYNAYLAYAEKYKDSNDAPFEIPQAYNLGQGAERERPAAIADNLKPQTIDGSLLQPVYPKNVKGRKNVKEAAEGIAKRYFGVTDTAVTALNAHGRSSITIGALASNGHADDNATKTGLPHFAWPMYKTHLKSIRSEAVRYPNPGPDGTFDADDFKDNIDELQMMIINPEENPTGTIYPEKYLKDLKDYIEDVNKDRIANNKQPILLFLDCPYFGAREANQNANIENGEHYYNTSPIKDYVMNTKHTPVLAAVAGTKFWATAEFGFTIMMANERAQKMIGPVALASNQLAGVSPVLDMMADFLSEDNDKLRLEFEADLRSKYAANRHTLETGLDGIDGVNIVPGNPGLVGLLELEQSYFFNKTLDGPVTGPYKINGQDDGGMTDIVEYLFLNHGIVTVNNGAENGKAYLRVANAESPENYAKAVPELTNGLKAIAHANPTWDMSNDFNDGLNHN